MEATGAAFTWSVISIRTICRPTVLIPAAGLKMDNPEGGPIATGEMVEIVF
jgi:hypothetical protein